MKTLFIIVITILAVLVVLAMLGVQPLSNAKGEVIDWFQKKGSQIDKKGVTSDEKPVLESYYVPLGGITGHGKAKKMRLKTIEIWEGKSSKEIKYKPPKSPWVVNAGYISTSKLGTKFDVNVWREVSPSIRVLAVGIPGRYGVFEGVKSIVIEQSGEHIIEVKASGCDWWVKVGIE